MVNVATLKSSDQVAFYNALTGSHIKKFETRAKAEERLSRAIKTADPVVLGKALATIGAPAPAPAKVESQPTPSIDTKPAHEVITDALADKVLAAVQSAPVSRPKGKIKKDKEPRAPKVKEVHTHLNLRCTVCGYYAKTTTTWLAKGRLACPITGHGNLLTPEEREEKRGVNKGKK